MGPSPSVGTIAEDLTRITRIYADLSEGINGGRLAVYDLSFLGNRLGTLMASRGGSLFIKARGGYDSVPVSERSA